MSLEERAERLIALIEEYRDRECREILSAAEDDARRALSEAYRRERARLHERVMTERASAGARIQAVRAERETRLRARGDRANARMLELAWPRLSAALERRWQAPQARRIWIGTALEQARASLPPGRWTIRHPPNWPAAERAEVSERVNRDRGQAPSFLADGALTCGLVIEGRGALLDMSLEGLLADRDRLAARMLALVAATDSSVEDPDP